MPLGVGTFEVICHCGQQFKTHCGECTTHLLKGNCSVCRRSLNISTPITPVVAPASAFKAKGDKGKDDNDKETKDDVKKQRPRWKRGSLRMVKM